MFQSEKQPLCRRCGKPIPKSTEMVWLNGHGRQDTGLYSLADTQRRENRAVVSVRYHYETKPFVSTIEPEPTGRRWVSGYSVWDGVTYTDQYFCSGPCVKAFAYVMARAGHVTRAYEEATTK